MMMAEMALKFTLWGQQLTKMIHGSFQWNRLISFRIHEDTLSPNYTTSIIPKVKSTNLLVTINIHYKLASQLLFTYFPVDKMFSRWMQLLILWHFHSVKMLASAQQRESSLHSWSKVWIRTEIKHSDSVLALSFTAELLLHCEKKHSYWVVGVIFLITKIELPCGMRLFLHYTCVRFIWL